MIGNDIGLRIHDLNDSCGERDIALDRRWDKKVCNPFSKFILCVASCRLPKSYIWYVVPQSCAACKR
jgi:hypothetical protein